MAYACGCIRHADQTWTLCADCSSRIGTHGTCLVCGGAANETWIANGDTALSGCSQECATQAAIDAHDFAATAARKATI